MNVTAHCANPFLCHNFFVLKKLISELVLFYLLLCLALGAKARVIEFVAFNLEVIACVEVPGYALVDLHIENLATPAAQEMSMRVRLAVVMHGALVNRQSMHGIVLPQELKRVVDRCARQGGHRLEQVLVNRVHCGMGVVVKQILHDSHALH